MWYIPIRIIRGSHLRFFSVAFTLEVRRLLPKGESGHSSLYRFSFLYTACRMWVPHSGLYDTTTYLTSMLILYFGIAYIKVCPNEIKRTVGSAADIFCVFAGPPRASVGPGADHFPAPSTSPHLSPSLPFPSPPLTLPPSPPLLFFPRLPSLLPSPSHSPPFPSLPSLPLEVGLLNPARGSGGAL